MILALEMRLKNKIKINTFIYIFIENKIVSASSLAILPLTILKSSHSIHYNYSLYC